MGKQTKSHPSDLLLHSERNIWTRMCQDDALAQHWVKESMMQVRLCLSQKSIILHLSKLAAYLEYPTVLQSALKLDFEVIIFLYHWEVTPLFFFQCFSLKHKQTKRTQNQTKSKQTNPIRTLYKSEVISLHLFSNCCFFHVFWRLCCWHGNTVVV